jgi:hypothetical protein
MESEFHLEIPLEDGLPKKTVAKMIEALPEQIGKPDGQLFTIRLARADATRAYPQ